MFNIELYNERRTFTFNDEPNICPICNRHIVAEPICAFSNKNDDSQEVLFHCNNKECSHIFIATYKYIEISKYTTKQMITKLSPQQINPIEINSDIKDISPLFYKIYQQSDEAKSLDLDEIAGVGYRKALEFLIKDYCIKNYPDKKEDIIKRPLLQVINSFMNDAPKVKSCATKAVWLGNDETHYERKWEDRDINDLKILIQLTLHHIESELLTEKFEMEMKK